jgi:glycosyltransferase involved in cell wall biosynthesis
MDEIEVVRMHESSTPEVSQQTTTPPLVSVVLPTYGRPDYLRRAVESVFTQSYTNIELIVIDDNEPLSIHRRDTRDVINALRRLSNFRIEYLERRENGGGARARNDGLAVARGEFITFLDDDDEYLPEKIANQVEHITNNQLDISLCEMQPVINGRISSHKLSKPKGVDLREFIISGNAFTPMIMLGRKLALLAGGFPNTPRFQDHLFMMRLLSLEPKVGILSQQLYRFHMHDGERITFSPKSIEAYSIKHHAENKYKYLLRPEEQKKVEIRQRAEMLYIKSRLKQSVAKDLAFSIKRASTFQEVMQYLKATIRGFASRSRNIRRIYSQVLNLLTSHKYASAKQN